MSYQPTAAIRAADSMSADAFGRLRVSSPTTIWDDQQFYGDSALRWENSVAGTGAVSNRIAGTTIESSVRLTTGGTASGAKVYRQTRVRHRYQPGKSQLVLMTFVAGAASTNVRRRVGLFDASDGIFLEETNGALRLVRRTNVTGTPSDDAYADKADWNIDPLDGTGPSGKTLDITKTNILVIDAQWLGVGRVRVGFSIDGVIYPAHQFLHAGVLTKVYTTTLCLPLRYEIENTGTAGATSTLDHICTAVMSEGGFEDPSGLTFTASNGVTTIGVTTRRPVLSIQANTVGPNNVRNIGHIVPKNIDIYAGTNGCFYEVVLNGTLTGASFAQVNASYSLANVDIAATAISGGLAIASGFVATATGSRSSASVDLFRELPLVYTGLGNVQDTLTIVATSLTGTSNVAAAIDWKELY